MIEIEKIKEKYFSSKVKWQSWLDVESNLAICQAEIGMIPEWASLEIKSKSDLSLIDLNELQTEIKKTRAEVFALTRVWGKVCGDAGGFIHWGATTQNIEDAGRLILLRKFHKSLMKELNSIIIKLSSIAKDHAGTIMIGRTLGSNALPITYGFKVAGWIDDFLKMIDQLNETSTRLFQLRFGGAVGGFHSFGAEGQVLADKIANKLGFNCAIVGNRNSQEAFLEYVIKLAMIGQLVSKVIQEFYYLSSEEVGEIKEKLNLDVVGSSTMPHKINPKQLIELKAYSNNLRGKLSDVMIYSNPLNEGDASSNKEIANMIESTCPLALYVLSDFSEILDKIEPNIKRMQLNVTKSEEFTSTEAIQMKLASFVGKGVAHDLINELVKESLSKNISFRNLLMENKIIKNYFNKADIDILMLAKNNLGECKKIALRVSSLAQEKTINFKGY